MQERTGGIPGGGTSAEGELERRKILDALEQCAGNQSQAAKVLGMSRQTFIRRLEEYAIARPRKRE
jgi:transcriptional regulator of acetoin/glycerol metabolism